MRIKDLNIEIENDYMDELGDVEVERVRFYHMTNKLEIDLFNVRPLSCTSFEMLNNRIKEMTGSESLIHVKTDHADINVMEIKKYLKYFASHESDYSILSDTNFNYDDQEMKLTFLFNDQSTADRESCYFEEIENRFHDIGVKGLKIASSLFVMNKVEIPNVVLDVIPEAEVKPQPEKKFYRNKSASKDQYTRIDLKDVTDPMQEIYFEGEIFALEDKETKAGKIIQTMAVFDGTDAISCKRFENRVITREVLSEVKKGDQVRIYGKIENDKFTGDLACFIETIEKMDRSKIVDTAERKRVEWHMHTNMSEMDAVCDVKSVVKYAWDIGHSGIVITDHADVQSLVKAYNTAAGLKKSDPDRPFKVGLGCEMNMADDRLLIVRNPIDADLNDAEFVSFDLETTGLSCYYDHIIEFGAVKMKNQTVTDRLQMFIKPPVEIPANIVRKTNITNEMVRNAKPFHEVVDEILEWIGDAVLVAHNATFDYYFMNEELRRLKRPPLKNCVIDTLDLARAVIRQRRTYRLGNISRHYKVAYDEEVAHRADYDAEALAGVFLCLLKDSSRNYGCKTIKDLQVKTQDFEVYKKVRRSHICVIAKNQQGIKDLYQLVSLSNTKTLAVMGKATGKEGTDVAAEARVLRSDLEKRREHLLFGSSCLNGEVFELACNGDDERLETAMKFYDYIELQPLSNYTTMVALDSVPSMQRIIEVQKRIMKMADRLGIPVIADSDAHYLRKDQKIFRDVYIMSQGVGGATHPLYIRDDNIRRKTKNPDQHLRFTDEMKREFDWIDDPETIERIVVENPNKLLDQLETVRPVPSGTYPPHIENSGELLRQICYQTADELYGFNGEIPAIVTERLNRELDNIIKHEFDVHYYIAHLLVKKSNDDGYMVGSRGSVGSSFTATMSKITEVNPLKPHYLCPHCKYSEWMDDPSIKSGFDLPDKTCPHCGATMKGQGQNIPFETFLGFNADKVPDIDLNFSNEYQWQAHNFIKEVFGEDHAFRAGTIGGVADKTAYGYVSGYCEKMGRENMNPAMKDYLAAGCAGVKRTTGQHPGGIIIIPENYDAEDFTPVQFPANDPSASWMTTHYDFHDIHDNVLKFDILGHVDPTAMRLMERISKVKPKEIPMNDPETLSLFYTDEALKADTRIYKKETGAMGLPEFGTATTRRVLETTRPHVFSELVMISGLSHGTDVWAGNAEALVKAGHPLSETIACRDDIMTYLMEKDLKPINAFKIMEDVRKGRGLREDQEEDMKSHNVPDWYIDSCKKIKYMFPKAHAVAYVMMAVRLAWYKVHEPINFYIQFFTLRSTAYEIETMSKDIATVRERMEDIRIRKQERNSANPVTNKEEALFDTLELCEEMYARGFRMSNVHLYKSKAVEFTVDPDDERTIVPPFVVVDGLGANVAHSIETARNQAEFLSKEDLEKRTQLSGTLIKKLDKMGVLAGMQEKNQMSLF